MIKEKIDLLQLQQLNTDEIGYSKGVDGFKIGFHYYPNSDEYSVSINQEIILDTHSDAIAVELYNRLNEEFLPVIKELLATQAKFTEQLRIHQLKQCFFHLSKHYEEGGTTRKLLYERLSVHSLPVTCAQWLSNILNVAREDKDFQMRLYEECYK